MHRYKAERGSKEFLMIKGGFVMKKIKLQGKLALLCMAFVCFAGCGSGGASSKNASAETTAAANDSYAGDIYYAETEEAAVTEEAAASAVSVASNRKLVKKVNLEIETEEFDKLVPTVEQRAEALGGYIEVLNIYNGSGYYGSSAKSANMTVRIPKDRLDSFVTEVAELSNIIRRDETVEDITLQYVDTESHKRALEIEQERLLTLLENADDLEGIITLEARLSEIRYELQNMESQLRTYDNLVDYATITLSISEVTDLTPVEEQTAWEKMSTGFKRSLNNIKTGLQDFVIGLVISLPYLILLAVIILIIVLIILLILKLSNKKTQKKASLYQAKAANPNHPNAQQTDSRPNTQTDKE